MKFAYADPPYLGCGAKHYGRQHEAAADWDSPEMHEKLLVHLRDEFPDGWALSLHAPSLEEYMHIARRVMGENCVRVGIWVKPFASFKPNVNPAFCFEPVLFHGGRSAADRGGRTAVTLRDYVSAPITLQRGTSGAKPDAFCYWLFEFLGARASDEFHDLFPGSGAVFRAWLTWCSQTRLAI